MSSVPLVGGDDGVEIPNKQIKRQPLSCATCRQRKVKCDRVLPCSACCARGHPKDCSFVVKDGEDYTPVSQSAEIRKLRIENQRLRDRFRKERQDPSGNDDHDVTQSHQQKSGKWRKFGIQKQQFFKSTDPDDNIYFGAPGLSEVIDQFHRISISDKVATLSHVIPRGADMYAFRKVPYPFPSFWLSTAGTTPLVNILPERIQMTAYLDTFQHRVQSCSFPHVPEEITESEIDRFMLDPFRSSEKHPEMLALIFAAITAGLQNGVYDSCGGRWVEGKKEEQEWKGDIWMAAAMQALRLANFSSRPSLLAIQAIIMICPYLTNSGRFLDAWTLFGTCIRLAHSIGLHRDPRHLHPAPSQTECHVRKSLWWWMLHMDQQYSSTLGRPLGISGIGDCPAPIPLTSDPSVVRVSIFINTFTILSRQILAAECLNLQKIDDFTDKLLSHYDTCPEVLQFNANWLETSESLPPWPLNAMSAVLYGKIHNYLILLNRQRIEHTSDERRTSKTSVSSNKSQSSKTSSEETSIRGRSRVLESSRCLLQAFRLFDERIPVALICWTMGQQAFNASMLLALNILEIAHRGEDDPDICDVETRSILDRDLHRIKTTHRTFLKMFRLRIHKLAGVAAEKLGKMIDIIDEAQQSQLQPHPDQSITDTVMGGTGMLLLEDPGLHTFRMQDEGFQPLNWRMQEVTDTCHLPNSSMVGSIVSNTVYPDSSQHSYIHGLDPTADPPCRASHGNPASLQGHWTWQETFKFSR